MTPPPWLTPDPWELEEDERRRERHRLTQARYRERHRAELRAKQSVYNLTHREQRRDAERRRREERRSLGAPIGALHELACTGPHRGNSQCRPVPVYRHD